MGFIIIMVALSAALQANQGTPRSQSNQQSFTITIPVSPETLEGQALLAAKAAEICGSKYPNLSRYQFEGLQKVAPDGAQQGAFTVRQNFECLDGPPAEAAGTPVPSDWKPSAQDEQHVRAITRRYFSLVDSGDAAAIHALWSASNRDLMPLDKRAEELAAFRRESGRLLDKHIAKITWYVNPPAAPAPGVYAAVDFERRYSRLALNCGYLIWFRQPDGNYVLQRQENSNLAKLDDNSQTSLTQARQLMRCPAGGG